MSSPPFHPLQLYRLLCAGGFSCPAILNFQRSYHIFISFFVHCMLKSNLSKGIYKMTPDKNPQKIKDMFDEISPYYDSVNNFMSLGTHYIIKFLAIRKLNIKPRSNILDLCCGSGDFVNIIKKYYPRVKVMGLDFSREMIKLAKSKNPDGTFIPGDCTDLPFKEKEFDYITMGFGLRNIENRSKAIDEIYRVLETGGKFLHLDFGYHNKLSALFNLFTSILIKILKKNSRHYEYLLKSKDDFPEPNELIKEFEQHGLKCIKICNYMFGTISAQILMKK